MIRIEDKHKCCGCEACVQACPKQCIIFKEDEEGFSYPKVDDILCINCGLCEKVCPVINQANSRQPLQCLASKNTDEAVRTASSSGGIFTLLAENVIRQGGVVFGAKFNEQWDVVHDYTETIEGLVAFRTSKYVQSRIGNCYKQVRDFLKKGRQVLFSGTSCQIAALRLFLHHEYENLLTVDIICHGVPSPKVWRMYLEEIKRNVRKGENSVSSPLTHLISERDAHGESIQIKSISFRDKRLGWKKYSFALTLAKASADGKQNTVLLSHIHKEDSYMKVFLRNINLRPSCYKCPAKAGKSGSDITLADFWGVEKHFPDFDDDKGVGLVLLNTRHGLEFYRCISTEDRLVLASSALASNPSYYHSVKAHPYRQKFFRAINNNVNVVLVMNKFSKKSICQRSQDEIRFRLAQIKRIMSTLLGV